MTTYATATLPEIQWNVDRSPGSCSDDFGHSKIYNAWGESEDGRKWIADFEVMHGEDVGIDLNSIQPDEA